MNDDEIHAQIEKLVAEEHKLWQRESDGKTQATASVSAWLG